jgi:ABC-type phosphate transport system permease subunit
MPQLFEGRMGLITKIFKWGNQPLTSEGTIQQWGAALVLVLIVAFLWKTVVDQVIE